MPLIELHKESRRGKGPLIYNGIRLAPRVKWRSLSIKLGDDLKHSFKNVKNLAVIYDTETRIMTLKEDSSGYLFAKTKKGFPYQELVISYHPALPKISKAVYVTQRASGAGWVEFVFPKGDL